MRTASSLARSLDRAGTNAAAQRAVHDLMREANVTVLDFRRRKPRRIVPGFAHSVRDLWFSTHETREIGRLARSGGTPSVADFSAVLELMIRKQVRPDVGARVLARWITNARRAARRSRTDRGLVVPLVVDRLARARGVDLAKAVPTTRLSGIEMFLAQMTMAPARSTRARGSGSATIGWGASAPVARSAGICGELSEGLGSIPFVGSWIKSGLRTVATKLISKLIPGAGTVSSIKNAVFAIATEVTVAPGSHPLAGGPDIHWKHFDQEAAAAAKHFKLKLSNGIPIPGALSECLELIGIDLPAGGAPRADVPVIWMADKEPVASIPEITGQKFLEQGRWTAERSNFAIEIGAKIVGLFASKELAGAGNTDAGGVADLRFDPYEEPSSYLGAKEGVLDGELLAIPLVAGTEADPVSIAANVAGALMKRRTFEVKIAHHPRLAWQFSAPPVTLQECDAGSPPECQSRTVAIQALRCNDYGVNIGPPLEPLTVGGAWSMFHAETISSDDGTFSNSYISFFTVPEEVGRTAGYGFPDQAYSGATYDEAKERFTRLADTPANGGVRIDYFGRSGDDDHALLRSQDVQVTPISDAAQLPPTGLACSPVERSPHSGTFGF